MKRTDLPDIISFLLILMFTYAAFSKLINFESFKIQMLIQPVPRWSVTPLIYIVPFSELVTVICLFFKGTRSFGLCTSVLLMLAFSIYVGLAITGAYGSIPCSCGGVLGHLTWSQHFVFNLFFLLLSIYGVFIDYKERRFIGR